jgi:hypothetical protein
MLYPLHFQGVKGPGGNDLLSACFHKGAEAGRHGAGVIIAYVRGLRFFKINFFAGEN